MNKTLSKEYCATKGGMKYAGVQLIIELWEGENFTSIPRIRQIFKECIKACDATLLKIDLHKFSPFGGISGIAVIQESHLSIHTWPEYNYAALDIFVCGTVDPYKAIPFIKKGFKPKRIQIVECKRGMF